VAGTKETAKPKFQVFSKIPSAFSDSGQRSQSPFDDKAYEGVWTKAIACRNHVDSFYGKWIYSSTLTHRCMVTFNAKGRQVYEWPVAETHPGSTSTISGIKYCIDGTPFEGNSLRSLRMPLAACYVPISIRTFL
jgi:hypothetical protein